MCYGILLSKSKVYKENIAISIIHDKNNWQLRIYKDKGNFYLYIKRNIPHRKLKYMYEEASK